MLPRAQVSESLNREVQLEAWQLVAFARAPARVSKYANSYIRGA